MKRTYRKSMLRTLRSTISRFLAIFAIVALGVGFLAGLLAVTPDMRYTADQYFDQTHLFDVRVVGTLGLTDDDIAALRAVEGVEEVMPAYTAELLVDTPSGDTLAARLHSLPMDQIEAQEPENYLNRFIVTEGRVPVKDDECVIEAGHLMNSGVQIGDTLTISGENEDVESTLARTQFKVVGTVRSGYYVAPQRESVTISDGTLDLVIYTGSQNFSLDAYTDAYISVSGAAELNSLEDSYQDFVDQTVRRIEDISGAQCAVRLADVRAETQAQLDDARAEYEDAKATADSELADAQAQLDEGQAEIDDAQAQLDAAQEEIESGEAQLQANKEQLPGTLTDSQNQLASAKAQLIIAKAQYEAGLQQVEAQEQALQEAKAQLAAAQQLVEVLGPLLEQAQNMIPQLEAQIPALQAAAQQAQAAADAAAQTALTERTNSNIAQLEADYAAAQAAVDAARGALSEEEWAAADPAAAGPLLAARDAARTAYESENARLTALDAAAATAQAAADQAQSQADNAQANLDAASAQIADYQAQIEQARQQIAQYEPLITNGEAQLEAARVQLAAALQQITAGEAQVAAGEIQLNLAPDIARLELDLAEEKLENAKQQYEDGTAQLAESQQQLDEGRAEFEAQKADAQAQLDDALQQIEDGQAALDELTECEWYVLDRQTNPGFVSFHSDVQQVEGIARVFPWFFFLVAALVALTTMTRMVEEERLQIGTLKALGFSKGAIMAKYVLYALAACIGGSLVGLAIGFTFFPIVIWNAYSIIYEFPALVCRFYASYAFLGSFLAVACTLAATLNACWSTLHEVPATLMLPKAPQAGKRILLERVTPVWRRMKFTHKVTARNLFRYKKRFFMTLIGIAGCTALLVTGFGLHDSISDIVYNQFGEIFTYDMTVSLREEGDIDSDAVQAVLGDTEAVTDTMLFHQEDGHADTEDGSFAVYLFVPEEPLQMPQFVHLRQRANGQEITFPEAGVVITELVSEQTGADVGDSVTLENADGAAASFQVTGVAENYVENYVYLSAETYEDGFGSQPAFTTVAAHLADDSEEARAALSERLLGLSQVSGVQMIADLKATFDDMMTNIDAIVVVLVAAAGMLAFVVLYNLTNINIAERVKEIATLKVLGFYDKEVSAYVYRENVMLSLMGAALGLVLGMLMHQFVIYSVHVDAVMFGRTVKVLSYLASAALTMVFSAFVNLVMNRKLKRISMVESMKAPE